MLFREMLQDPTNVDLTLRYAEAAAELGNLEAAISSLERLLLYNRNFPGAKLELAQFYARLGSYTVARTYLTQVETMPGVDADTLARAKALRNEIERASSPSQFRYNALVGLRYQTNINAEPAGSDIVAGGIPQTLSSLTTHHSGWDAFANGSVQHSYDFGDFQWESNALAYYSKQLRIGSLDVGAIEVNTGPRLDIKPGDKLLFAARPYVLANEVQLGNRQYLWTGGAGIEAERGFTTNLGGNAFYEYRYERFSDTPAAPAASTTSGSVHAVGAGLTYKVSDDGTLSYQTSYALSDAFSSSSLSSNGLVLRLGYSHNIHLPPQLGVGPLILMPVVYWVYSRNDGPDPAFSPPLTPSTREWRYGGTAKLGLNNNMAATFHVIHEQSISNVPGNRTHNTQLIFSVLFAY